MLLRISAWRFAFVGVASMLVAVSCTKQEGAKVPLSGITQPKTGDPESPENQLKRVLGNKKFLTIGLTKEAMESRAKNFRAEMAAAGGDAGGGAKREVEESDIFKIEGDLIYLLNNYRGIQVVSYAKGAEKPELLARVPATGNFPEDMFYDKELRRLYILEKYYYEESNSYYREQSSRLLVYDAKDPNRPKPVQEPLRLEGSAAAVQRVGQVLYVATTAYPYGELWYNSEKGTGHIISIKLNGEKGAEVAQDLQLTNPLAVSWNQQEPISVIEVPRGEKKFSYYILARLRKGSWWSAQSTQYIEVIDITDAKGAITPVFAARAKGDISEKSQAFIKDDTLVVVSRYRSQYGKKTMQIGVESFKFPGKDPEVISEKQGLKRKLDIELKLEAIHNDDERYAAEKKLLADPSTGLAGVFINTQVKAPDWQGKNAQYGLVKAAPDVSLSLGPDDANDPTIEDVRVAGDRAYIFWVPTNLVDPLDIVDISNPQVALKHLGRTRFNGWVERSFPVRHGDTEYIVSLGQGVPEVNNETGARVPQVRVFEIPKNLAELQGEAREAKRVAMYEMESLKNTWLNFNGPDKQISLVPVRDGAYVAMFPFTSWQAGQRGSGAKIVGVDFTKKDQAMISESTLFAKNMDWIRRVFNNPKTKLNHAFSDKSIAAFEPADRGAKLLSLLELARDIKAYVALKGGGVQVIEDYVSAGEESEVVPELTLRLVDTNRADSEKPEAKAETKISMPYRQHVVGKDGGLYLVGTKNRYEEKGEGKNRKYYSYIDVSVARASVKDGKIAVSAVAKATLTAPERHFGGWGWRGRRGMVADIAIGRWLPFYEDVTILELPTGELAFSNGDDLSIVKASGDRLEVQSVKLASCTDKAKAVSLSLVSGKLVASYSVSEGPVPGLKDYEYLRGFVAKASIEGGALKCSHAINIPGTAKFFIADDHLVSEDTFVVDSKRVKEEDPETKKRFTVITNEKRQTNLFSLALKDNVATLVHDYDPSGVSADNMQQVGKKLVFLEAAQPDYYDYRGRYETGSDTLSVLSFNEDKFFTKQPRTLGLSFQPQNLVSIVDDPSERGAKLALVTSYRQGAVLSLNLDKGDTVELKQVSRINERFEREKPKDSFDILAASGWRYGRLQSVNFTPSQRTFEFAEGLFGVEQFAVEK